jgi:20S proteasome subunit beta 3
MEYNGGSVVAMIGKDCVAIASDLRLGQQQVGVAMNFDKVRQLGRPKALANHQVFPVNDKLYYGLPGLASDTYTLSVVHVPRQTRADRIEKSTCDSE